MTRSQLSLELEALARLDSSASARSLVAELGLSAEVEDTIVADLAVRSASLLDLADALGAVEDTEELYRSLAFVWLGLRSDWTRLNLTIQYRTVNQGEPRASDVASASVVSALLAGIEPLLAPVDLDLLIRVAAEPLAISLPERDWLDRFLQNQRAAIESVERQALGLEAPRPSSLMRTSRAPAALGPLAREYTAQAAALRETAGELARIPLSLVWAPLAERVAERLAPRRVVLVNNSTAERRVDVRESERLESALTEAVAIALENTGNLPRPVVYCDVGEDGETIDVRVDTIPTAAPPAVEPEISPST